MRVNAMIWRPRYAPRVNPCVLLKVPEPITSPRARRFATPLIRSPTPCFV